MQSYDACRHNSKVLCPMLYPPPTKMRPKHGLIKVYLDLNMTSLISCPLGEAIQPPTRTESTPYIEAFELWGGLGIKSQPSGNIGNNLVITECSPTWPETLPTFWVVLNLPYTSPKPTLYQRWSTERRPTSGYPLIWANHGEL